MRICIFLLFVAQLCLAKVSISLDVIDVRNADEKTELLAASLQGNINRADPRIFLLWGGSYYPSYDSLWIKYYAEKGWITYTRVSIDSALSKYSSELSGFIVYDPDFRHSINIATTMAGLYNALICHPDLITYLQGFGLSMIRDLRGMWSNAEDAYQWQYDSLYANCNKDLIGHTLIVDGLNGRDQTIHSIRDFLIMKRAATISLFYAPADTASDLIRIYYEEQNPLGLVLGWPIDSTELAYVHLASQHQLIVVPCRAFSQNFSIHSQIPGETTYTQTHIDSVILDTTKVYCSFLMVDGGIDMLDSRFYLAWDDPTRGDIPVNWYFSPVLIDLCPGIMQHYYESKTSNDYFIAGFGLGYVFPSDLPDLNMYVERSLSYLTASDIKVVALINRFRMDEHVINTYTSVLQDCIGFKQGYGPSGFRPGNYRFVNNKPWIITAAFAWADGSLSQVQEAIENFVSERPERPLFCPVWVHLFGVYNVDSVKTLMESLEANNPGTYKFVKLDEFMLALKKYVSFFDSSNYIPDSFNISYGTLFQGGLTDLYSNDSNYLVINSEHIGAEHYTGFCADYHIQEEPIRLWITYDGHFSRRVTNSLWLWNYVSSDWEFIGWRSIDSLDWRHYDGIVYNAQDFVRDSLIKIGVLASSEEGFTTYADYLNLEVFFKKNTGVSETSKQTEISTFKIYPNLSNSLITVRYSMTRPAHIELNIYNLAGQLIKTLVDGQQEAGIYEIEWDGEDAEGKPMPSGVYFIKLKAGEFLETKKALLLR